MPVETKEKAEEKEETTLDKIAKSSGADTEKYAEELEQEADNMLNEMYHPEKFEEDQKAKKEEEEKEEAEKAAKEEEESTEEDKDKDKTEKEEKPEEKKETEETKEDDEITADDKETIASITEKLVKSEQRVKDNRKAFSTSKKELSEERIASKAVVETFNQTIKDLQTGITQKAEASTKQEEKAATEEIKETVVDLKAQFEVLDKIDPDIAAPIKKLIEGIAGKITGLNGKLAGLKTEIKTKEDTATKTAQETADDNHYSAIEDAHKDWEDIIDSPEFEDYIEGLSPRNQRLARQDIKNGSAENIIEIFSDYKTATGITTEKDDATEEKDDDTKTGAKADKLKAAKKMANPDLRKSKEIKTTAKVKYTRAMIRDESAKDPTWFETNEADIDIEMAAGRIPDR